jgi:protein-S-isoprenylcysteine O-methyltransferase Ste14
MLSYSAGLWIVWWAGWLVVGLFAKPNFKQEALTSRLCHMLPLAAGLLLVFATLVISPQFVLWNHVNLRSAGLVVTGLGLAIACWSRYYLGRNWSGLVAAKTDHQLVISGPYRFVRHPIYTGLALAILGSALSAGTLGAIGGAGLVVAAFTIKLLHEEKFLTGTLGRPYICLKQQVRSRLVPYDYRLF